jgi:hypothetical protein
MWTIVAGDDIDRRLRNYKKQWSHEMKNVFVNLDQVLAALEYGTKPEQLKKLGFVHSEPQGVIAIDQSGKGKRAKMKEFRAYLYPDEEDHKLHFIRLGDKTTQAGDLRYCSQYVVGLLRQKGESGQSPVG